MENFSSDKFVTNIFFDVVSNSSMGFEGNNPPGISGIDVKRWRFTAILKAVPQTWFIIGIKLKKIVKLFLRKRGRKNHQVT